MFSFLRVNVYTRLFIRFHHDCSVSVVLLDTDSFFITSRVLASASLWCCHARCKDSGVISSGWM